MVTYRTALDGRIRLDMHFAFGSNRVWSYAYGIEWLNRHSIQVFCVTCNFIQWWALDGSVSLVVWASLINYAIQAKHKE